MPGRVYSTRETVSALKFGKTWSKMPVMFISASTGQVVRSTGSFSNNAPRSTVTMSTFSNAPHFRYRVQGQMPNIFVELFDHLPFFELSQHRIEQRGTTEPVDPLFGVLILRGIL